MSYKHNLYWFRERIARGEYDAVINDYTRAKLLFKDTDVAVFKTVLLPSSPTCLPSTSLPLPLFLYLCSSACPLRLSPPPVPSAFTLRIYPPHLPSAWPIHQSVISSSFSPSFPSISSLSHSSSFPPSPFPSTIPSFSSYIPPLPPFSPPSFSPPPVPSSSCNESAPAIHGTLSSISLIRFMVKWKKRWKHSGNLCMTSCWRCQLL